MITKDEEYNLVLLMTENYSDLSKEQLIDLINYLLQCNYEYYLNELDRVFNNA